MLFLTQSMSQLLIDPVLLLQVFHVCMLSADLRTANMTLNINGV